MRHTNAPAVFALAPMSPAFRWLTVVLLLLPAVLTVAAAVSGLRALLLVALFMLLTYGAVWVAARPTRFEITERRLDAVFPLWRRSILTADIVGARLISGREFQREFGFPLRIGVGGLWGGFGWLWTTRRGLVEFYVSRTDGLVLVERQQGRPLLLTPDSPEAMVERIGPRSTAPA